MFILEALAAGSTVVATKTGEWRSFKGTRTISWVDNADDVVVPQLAEALVAALAVQPSSADQQADVAWLEANASAQAVGDVLRSTYLSLSKGATVLERALKRLRRRTADGQSDVRAAASNGSWSAVQQAATMASNSIIGLLLVLVLPVGEFGAYTYATALAAFGMAVMSGGLANLGVKMVLEHDRGSGAERSTVTGLLIARNYSASPAWRSSL